MKFSEMKPGTLLWLTKRIASDDPQKQEMFLLLNVSDLIKDCIKHTYFKIKSSATFDILWNDTYGDFDMWIKVISQ